MATRAPAAGRLLGGVRKWYYNMCGFNKIGLMRDDTIYEDADVKEAIRRLPEAVYNDRMFRIKRALDLSMKQQILPKDQWTKYEEVNLHEQILMFCLFLKKKDVEHCFSLCRFKCHA
uniref:Cytochrome b-c1 complex subunit 7 n=1 Tax=Amphiprion ocellaris TaxID=80972 RepID=A0AAQ5Y1S2_AMPOC